MSNQNDQPRGLTVNAAFLKDIKDDNRDLKCLLDNIVPLMEYPQTATNHWQEVVDLLAALRDQLAMHFSLEEAYGYFDDAIGSAAQLSESAERLRGQHSPLFEKIRELAEKAVEIHDDCPDKVTGFLADFQRFRQAFEQHEEEELKLILDALDDDLGVGD